VIDGVTALDRGQFYIILSYLHGLSADQSLPYLFIFVIICYTNTSGLLMNDLFLFYSTER